MLVELMRNCRGRQAMVAKAAATTILELANESHVDARVEKLVAVRMSALMAEARRRLELQQASGERQLTEQGATADEHR